MNPYLTNKAEKLGVLQIVVIAICGLFTVAEATLLPGYLKTGDFMKISMGIFLFLAFLLPLLWIVWRFFLRHKAERIAAWFAYYKEDSVTFEKLTAETKPGIVTSIDRLLRMGYLQNLHIDYEHSSIELTAETRLVKVNVYAVVICPHCGGKNQVVKGRVTRCNFCDQPLGMK